jgi:hypothetical protein
MCLGARRIAVHEEVTTMTYTGDAPSPTKATSIERDQLSLVQIVPPPRGDAEVSGPKRIQLAEVGGSDIKTTEKVAPSCASSDARDPFALNVRFANDDSVAPENRGKCVDTSQKRPIHILSKQEIADLKIAPAAPGETIVANFHYKDKFYIARLPSDGVSNIIAEKELFNPGIPVGDQLNMVLGFSAHFQQRFQFKPGKDVVLLPPDDPTNASKAIHIRNVIASDEAVPRQGGEDFDIDKGLHGHYAFARTLTGLEEKYDDMIGKQNHKVLQWQIKPVVNKNVLIDGKTPTADLMRQAYLRSALELSDADYQSYKQGRPLMYNTFQNSCITGGFEIYDRVNNYSNPVQPEVEQLKRNPMFIRQMLFSRGLLSLKEFSLVLHKTPDLKTEVASHQHFTW